MSHLPKFVRERLKAAVSPIGHPDPEMLTAFSERSLPAHERAVVMEHLARCGECRDVVALALPATEAVTQTASVGHRDWFRWPVLRWGALAAGVLILASIGIQQYRERDQTLAAFVADKQTAQNGRVQDQIARNEAPRNEAQNDEFRPSTPASQSATEHTQNEASVAGKAPAPAEAAPSALSARAKSSSIRSGFGGPALKGLGGIGAANQLSNNLQNQLAANSPQKNSFAFNTYSVPSAPPKPVALARSTRGAPVPSVSEMVEVQSAAGAPSGRNGQRQDLGQLQDQLPDLKQSQQQSADVGHSDAYSDSDKALSKAKPATEQVVVTAAAPAIDAASSPEPILTARNIGSLPGPTWSITATGGLQRSLDSGKTWQDVRVTASPAAVSGLVAEQVAVYGHEKKSRDKKDAKAAKEKAGGTPVFRAVSANGLDVWAGGSAGALFHSADAGDHWTRILPLSGSTLLTTDITSIRFSDLQNGTITTATSEVWTTTDAGRSWHQQ